MGRQYLLVAAAVALPTPAGGNTASIALDVGVMPRFALTSTHADSTFGISEAEPDKFSPLDLASSGCRPGPARPGVAIEV